ncbi:MAG: Transcription initiation factor TFIID subunit 13, partial [Piccolia ochrophora]
MAEPRARATHHRGQQNFTKDLRALLFATGDSPPSLPSTLQTLDEIVTDYIIETCHEASRYASYARRQKIKVDDFRFVLRRDPAKLGRVQELLAMDKLLKAERRLFDEKDDRVEGVEGEGLDGGGGGGGAEAEAGAG